MQQDLFVKGRQYPPQRIADLIFENRLSTSNQLTEISGRGVGMEAVRQYINRAGGSIHLVLNGLPRNGFCAFAFHIHVPRHLSTMVA